jgi:uncharacterized membrane protein YczE
VGVLLVGLLCVAAGVACMIDAELGVAPYDVTSTGLSELLGIPIGLAAVLLPTVFVAVGLALSERLAWGTVLCVALVGPTLDLVLHLLPELEALAPRIGLYAIGFVVLAVGITLTIAPDIGAGPAELVMLAVHHRGPALAPTRTAIELTCVVVGWAMGGQVGVGTLVFALLIGPTLRRSLEAVGFDAARAAEASDLAAPGA